MLHTETGKKRIQTNDKSVELQSSLVVVETQSVVFYINNYIIKDNTQIHRSLYS